MATDLAQHAQECGVQLVAQALADGFEQGHRLVAAVQVGTAGDQGLSGLVPAGFLQQGGRHASA